MNVFIETEKRKFEELKRSGDTTDGHIRKVEPWPVTFGGTRDPGPITWVRSGSETGDP